jgi:hypothetical protein
VLSSYLGEDFSLNTFCAVVQIHQLGGQVVNDLTMIFNGFLASLQFLCLCFHPPDEVIDHIGQLIDVHILCVNPVVEFIDKLPYLVGSLAQKVDSFRQMVQGMVLCQGNIPDCQLKTMNLGQEFSPNCSGIMGVPLPPHLSLSLLRFKQTSFQQAV